ncbi:hypothetical protein [Streptomyces sp. NRRL F-5630]|uniref:hypothetical protein n=1 Tax=Streptomyces sp. NRRL F-5630 TaxID=1463864 RepID=UPI003EB8E6E1
MGFCDWWIVDRNSSAYCRAKEGAADAVADAASSAWESIVHDFMSGAVWMVKQVGLGWLKLDSPTLDSGEGALHFLLSSTSVLVGGFAVLSIMLAAGRMAWTRRADGARDVAAAMLRLIASTGLAVGIVNALAFAGDRFSVWLINRSLGCSGDTAAECSGKFASTLQDMMSTLDEGDQMAIAFIMALLMIVSGLFQLVTIVARQAMLFVLMGTLPLAASLSSTERGQDWWRKSTGWLIAFLAYKPAAAIIYATSFAQFRSAADAPKGDGLMPQLYGVVLLIMAAVTLPALMRVIVPAVAEGGLTSGGGASGAGTAARLASGAIAVKTGGLSKVAAVGAAKGGTSGGPGGSGPTGGGPAGGGGRAPGGSGAPSPQGGGSGTPGSAGEKGASGASEASQGSSGSGSSAPSSSSSTSAPSAPPSTPARPSSAPSSAPAPNPAPARASVPASPSPARQTSAASGAPARPAAPAPRPAPTPTAPSAPRPRGPRGSNN